MMSIRGGLVCTVLVSGLLLSSVTFAAQNDKTAPDFIAKGKYLTEAAGCIVCHTDADHHGAAFAGGRALHTTFGTFYAPNITPDKRTGIGNWSEQDFQRALHDGIRPDGSNLYPVFPYTSYTQLRDEDVRAIWAYLRSLPPVQQPNKTNQLKWYAPPRFMVWFWKKLYFDPGRYRDNPQRSVSWNRGAYLVNAVAHCAECHTPRNILGAEKSDLRYAGANNIPEDFVAPNITPDANTGIGDWSRGDIVEYLQTGLDPDGDTAGNVMAEFIDSGLSHLSKNDLQAIAEYVKSLPSIEHSLHKKSKQATQKPEWD
jgi:mono/diheme cytochrome c family protein